MKEEVKYTALTPHAGIISGERSIICSDIGVIQGRDFSLLVDAGASNFQAELFKSLIKNGVLKDNFKHLVITHFHPDHINGAGFYQPINIVGTKNTARYTHVDTIVNDKIQFDLGDVRVEVGSLPSIHAKGSLYIYIVDEQTLFIGDGLCLKERDGVFYTNKDVTFNTAKTLLSLPTKTIVPGHGDMNLTLSAYNEYINYLYNECLKAKTSEIELKTIC